MTFGTNHVAHFYLTMLLLPLLRSSAPSRVVVTSSMLHEKGHFEPPNWQLLDNNHKKYGCVRAYAAAAAPSPRRVFFVLWICAILWGVLGP